MSMVMMMMMTIIIIITINYYYYYFNFLLLLLLLLLLIVMKRKYCNSDRHRLAYNNTDSSSTHDFIRLLQINRNRLFLLLLSWDVSLITIHHSAVQCNMIDMSRISYTVTMF